jgi:hypothetical protein
MCGWRGTFSNGLLKMVGHDPKGFDHAGLHRTLDGVPAAVASRERMRDRRTAAVLLQRWRDDMEELGVALTPQVGRPGRKGEIRRHGDM